MSRWVSRSEEETRRVGRRLAARLLEGGVVLLEGDLGVGKTVFVRGLAEGLGVDPGEIQSPSFTLVREHHGERGRLLHIDLHRLTPKEVPGVGLEEWLAGPGVKVVEWAERLPFPVEARIRLRLERRGDGGRDIIEEEGPRA